MEVEVPGGAGYNGGGESGQGPTLSLFSGGNLLAQETEDEGRDEE